MLKKSLIALALTTIPMQANASKDLKSLFSMQDVEVVSVSKTPEKAFDAASSIFVINQSDIQRSGATSIPEVLRLVPGIEVARIDSNKWAITARGFNRQFVNKMLVMIDGRSVYTPLFSGTYWDVQDTILEDIERIEVIKGPGATLWGANAVNGVINIITKEARDTQGTMVSAMHGTEERGNFSARQGGKIGENGHYRVFGKYFKRKESLTSTGLGSNDEWEMGRGGFKVDWTNTAKHQFTVQGDMYQGYNEWPLWFPGAASSVPGDEETSGANLMAKWKYAQSSDSIFDVQVYLDYIKRDVAILDQDRTTIDLEFQHSWNKIKDHAITWGGGYRMFKDDLTTKLVDGVNYIDYTPDESYNNLYSAFIQDKITLIEDKLYFTAGSKFEHNFYTDFEIQPNARLTWLPNDKNTVWASVSRSTRTPSRGERSIALVAGGSNPSFIRQVGGNHMESEEMIAYELGYRVRPLSNLSFDISTFYNDYDNLRSYEPNGTLNIPLSNKSYAETYGFEISSEWNVLENWSLIAGYNLLKVDMHLDADSTDIFTEPGDEKASPQNQFKLRSHLNITPKVEFDNILYYVDNVTSKNIDNYIRFDTRLAWKPNENVEFSLVGQNLFDDSHPEFAKSLFSVPSEIERSFYGKVTLNF